MLNDGTKLKAELVGKDTKTDLALLRGEARQAAEGGEVRQFRQAAARRMGDRDRQSVQPRRHGDGRHRVGAQPRHQFRARTTITSRPTPPSIAAIPAVRCSISTARSIGVNTAIISPSGGSIGIGFAVPSKTAMAVIDQLRQFGEARRGWLGVRIQQVTDDIAESLDIKPARGALVAGVDDKGPAKPAGIEPGDVIVKFDGKDIKEMRDLPRIVADTPVGKDVTVHRHPQGQGRDQDRAARPARGHAAAGIGARPMRRAEQKSVVQKALGLESRRHDRRPAQEVQDQGHREGRGHHRASRRTRLPPTSGSTPATSSSR